MKFKIRALSSAALGVSLAITAMTTNAVVLEDDASSYNPSHIQSQSATAPQTRQVIVQYNNELSTLQSAIQSTSSNQSIAMAQAASKAANASMRYERQMGTGAHVYTFDQKMSAEEFSIAIAKLSADPTISEVLEDKKMRIMATPNDPRYNDQWHYYEATGGLNLPGAWDNSTGTGAVVAVIDTGITNHSDLNANILPGYDMISNPATANDGGGRDSDPSDTGDMQELNECPSRPQQINSSWHGTHVAGTIAAVSNNNRGVAGVAYNAKIVPVRALGVCGGSFSDIADSIIWAAGGSVPGVPANQNPADVINLSLGGGGACNSQIQAAVNTAVGLGATLVVAAGNSTENASNAVPANCQNVVAVAATGRTGARAPYSNFGNVVDVAAPGGNVRTGRSDGVLSTLNTGTDGPVNESYAFYQGTSMAAPHVAGVAALMYAVDTNITPAEVESLLKSTARSFPASCSGCGTGIVDADAVIDALSGGSQPPAGNVLSNGQTVTGQSGALGSQTFFTLEVPAGASGLTFTMSGGSGDADLYVRFGTAPTTTTFDCRPFRTGNNETCSISNVQAGTYHVMIRGYAAYSGVSIVANYTAGGTGGGNQAPSIDVNNLSGAAGQWRSTTINVPAGQSQLVVQISGGTGDADLYLRRGANPTTTTYDCRPFRTGNNETCTINNPQAGTWNIRLRGFSAFSGGRLRASSQ